MKRDPEVAANVLPKVLSLVCTSAPLHVCMCTVCMPAASKHKKGALESQMVVSHGVGAGNLTKVLPL